MTPHQHTRRFFRQHHFDFFLSLLFITSVVIAFTVFFLERNVGTINTPFDAMRWHVDMVTTVGVGDLVPVTALGKVLSMLLQIVGAVMFGLVIAVTSIYITRSQDEFQRARLFERIDRLESELREVRKRAGFIVQTEVQSEAQTQSRVKTQVKNQKEAVANLKAKK